MDLQLVEQQFTWNAAALLPYLRDSEVTDLLINGTRTCYFEKGGVLFPVENPFKDQEQIRNWIERLLIPIHKRLDAKYPYVDGRLLEGSHPRQR